MNQRSAGGSLPADVGNGHVLHRAGSASVLRRGGRWWRWALTRVGWLPIRITLLYALLASLWILFSDRLVASLTTDVETLTNYQSFKGWFYVLVTSVVLYPLLRRSFSSLQQSRQALERSYQETLYGWSQAMDLRDKETEGHTQRVTDLALWLARELGVDEEELVHIHRGALLHDVGKLAIPDAILLKPGPLTEEEWVVMRKHPVYAYEFLHRVEYLRPALAIPRYHHEKWDGTGYPYGLKGEEIPLAARIFAVADVWDALRSDRPYRRAWSAEQALAHIKSEAGTHFDPQVVAAFLRVVEAS